MSTYEQRKSASLGKEYVLYCKNCMQENEVYSAVGHLPNQKNLHCVMCSQFVTRIKFDGKSWELDFSVYK